MSQHHIRHVPVVKGGRLLGIVSHRDVRTATATGVASAQWLMTPDPVTVTPDARIEHAARLMLNGRFGALPVMDGATLGGIATCTDLLRAFVHVIETATEDRIAVDWAA